MIPVKEISIRLVYQHKRGSYFFFVNDMQSPHYPITLSFHWDDYEAMGKPEAVEVTIKPGEDDAASGQ